MKASPITSPPAAASRAPQPRSGRSLRVLGSRHPGRGQTGGVAGAEHARCRLRATWSATPWCAARLVAPDVTSAGHGPRWLAGECASAPGTPRPQEGREETLSEGPDRRRHEARPRLGPSVRFLPPGVGSALWPAA